MEKVIPLNFVIDKNNGSNGENQLIKSDFSMNDSHYIMECIRNIYSQNNFAQAYPECTESSLTRFVVGLEGGGNIVLWNLKKYGGKLICPISLDDDDIGNIIYSETDKYNIVCLNLICCENTDKNENGMVLNAETGEEKLPLEGTDTLSRTFKCGFAISKYIENDGKRFSGFIFGSKKGLHGCVKAWTELLKATFESNDFKFTGSVGINRQRLKAINNSIKEMVITKNIIGKTMGGGTEEELTLELCLKGKVGFDIENILNRLLGRSNLGTENLEFLEQFWDSSMTEENVTLYRESGNGKEKKLGIDIDGEEFIAFSSEDIGSSENGYTLTEYNNLILDYLNSLAND